jgi:Cu(I)/Ag(I) efflux system protein CusF
MKFIPMLAIAALAVNITPSTRAKTPTVAPADQSIHQPATVAAAPQSEGEVRKVDKEQGKLTLRHGPLQNLDMPAMTMVFKVADEKMLESIKEGDKVWFTAEKINGAITVTAIQPAR